MTREQAIDEAVRRVMRDHAVAMNWVHTATHVPLWFMALVNHEFARLMGSEFARVAGYEFDRRASFE